MMMKSAPTVGLELIDNSGLSCNDLHGKLEVKKYSRKGK